MPARPKFRAQKDDLTRRWHAGTPQGKNVTICGVHLTSAADPTVAKYLSRSAEFVTDDDLTKIDCGSCLRNRAYRDRDQADRATDAVARAGSRERTRRRTVKRTAAQKRADAAAAAAGAEAARQGASPATVAQTAYAARDAALATTEWGSSPVVLAPNHPDPTLKTRKRRKSRADRAVELQDRDAAARAALAAVDASLEANTAQ